MTATETYYERKIAEQAAAIQRVRELHRPHLFEKAAFLGDPGPELHCWHCATEVQNWWPGEPYPCPTIKALDGEE